MMAQQRYALVKQIIRLVPASQGGSRPRPCENVREPRKRRTGFSIAFLAQPPPAFLVFRLTKLRRTFYEQIERASFRTAWVGLSRRLGVEGGRRFRRAANGF